MRTTSIKIATMLALALAPAGAIAADVNTKAPAGVAAVPTTDPFTGIYVGAHLGYGFDTTGAGIFAVESASSLAASPQGFAGGLHAGIGTRFASQLLYAGIETDIDIANLKGSAANPAAGLITASSNDDWFGTTRARLGVFLLPTLMLYGTAGVAYGNPSASFTLNSITPATFNASSTKMGWAAGGGVEFALGSGGKWIARAEWMRIDLGSVGVTNGAAGAAAVSFNPTFQTDILRAGLSYKF